ncbi:MAG: nucleotidyltransferase domain-containing protein [Emticicia sp.]|nr:nucleotidyltransferase domain-containing protein [Emticicia sp.]
MILVGLVGLISKMFQNDFHSLYLGGSYLNNTFTDGSDIDLILVIQNHNSKDSLNEFREHINLISPIWIDLKVYDTIEIQRAGFPNLKIQ